MCVCMYMCVHMNILREREGDNRALEAGGLLHSERLGTLHPRQPVAFVLPKVDVLQACSYNPTVAYSSPCSPKVAHASSYNPAVEVCLRPKWP